MRSLVFSKRLVGAGALAAAVSLSLAGCGVSKTKTVTVHAVGSATSGATSSNTSTTSTSTAKAAGPSTLTHTQLESPVAILAAAVKAGTQAKTVRISGSVVDSGLRVALNMVFERGVGYMGYMQMGSIGFWVDAVGSQVYFKYPTSSWITLLTKEGFSTAEAERVAKKYAYRWIRMSAAQSKQMTSTFSLEKLLGQLGQGHGVLKRVADSTVGGQPAIVVADTTKGGSLYVAANGEPYPLMVTAGNTAKSNSLTFSNYNANVQVERPANALSLGDSAGVTVAFHVHTTPRSVA